jgi:chlorite dismutase
MLLYYITHYVTQHYTLYITQHSADKVKGSLSRENRSSTQEARHHQENIEHTGTTCKGDRIGFNGYKTGKATMLWKLRFRREAHHAFYQSTGAGQRFYFS